MLPSPTSSLSVRGALPAPPALPQANPTRSSLPRVSQPIGRWDTGKVIKLPVAPHSPPRTAPLVTCALGLPSLLPTLPFPPCTQAHSDHPQPPSQGVKSSFHSSSWHYRGPLSLGSWSLSPLPTPSLHTVTNVLNRSCCGLAHVGLLSFLMRSLFMGVNGLRFLFGCSRVVLISPVWYSDPPACMYIYTCSFSLGNGFPFLPWVILLIISKRQFSLVGIPP